MSAVLPRLRRVTALPLASAGLLALMIAACASAAMAQVIHGSALPGREREQLLDRRPAPRAQPGGPSISLPSTEAPASAAATLLTVARIRIVGSTVYGEEQLAPLYRDLIGKRVSLQAVYDLARRVTARYGADGYVLSRAIVPPQELNPKGATIRIQVVEGFIDRVEWPREKLARYRDFFSEYSAKIVAQRPVNVSTLERYLLLANDLPGLKFTTSLRASKTEPGASTLVVEVAEKPLDVLVRADNRGTQSRGPYQYLLAPTLNNVLGNHEALTLAYAGVVPFKQLQFLAPSYRQVLNSEGLTAFVNGIYSWGRPGTVPLETLDFATRSTLVEAGLSSPVIRSRERNLTLTALAFASENYSFVFGSPFNVDRLRGLRLRADADMADKLGGINQFSVTVSQGLDGLGSTANGSLLASRAAGRVDFTKLEGYASRLQPLVGPFSAFIAGYGQYAATALLSPEQCGYGGRVFGRGYDPSDLLGDQCWEATGELRYDLPAAPIPVSAQLYGFFDKGTVYTISPAAGTPGSVTAASAGSGVRLGWGNQVNVDLSAAKAIEGPRNDWRFFFVTTARY
jgi:hemolysin activation/secretion protein